MISSLMIITSVAMLAFPKQLRGNRIPAPHQVESIDAHKAAPKVEQQPEEESIPQLKGKPFNTIALPSFWSTNSKSFNFDSFLSPRFPKDDQKTLEKWHSHVPNGIVRVAFTSDCRSLYIFAQIFRISISFAHSWCKLSHRFGRYSCDGNWHYYFCICFVEIQSDRAFGSCMDCIYRVDVFAWYGHFNVYRMLVGQLRIEYRQCNR